MTRSSWGIAGTVAGVAVVLLAGAWLLFAGREPVPGTAAADQPDVATTTVLTWPPDLP